jgi:hypothetical protein
MSKKLVIQHDLSKLSPEQLVQYLRDVSEFIGLDPDLNGLDTIWMPNENGPGQSLVVYARRGTAEILRQIQGVEVSSLTHQMVKGSIVFTATGKNAKGRQEIAIGSKFIEQLLGKALDDAVMTASTRALRRLTMQFTSLGILDESEVKAIIGDTSNPATAATLSGSAMVIPPPQVAPNNAPGKDVTPDPDRNGSYNDLKAPAGTNNAEPEVKPTFAETQKAMQDDAQAFLKAKDAPVAEATPKPKRARKPKTVSLEGPEPEIVNTPLDEKIAELQKTIVDVPALPSAPVQVNPAVPVQANPVPATDFPGKPTDAQMIDYRKRVSVFTAELPSSENMGSVQKMRAFITKMSGTAPQFMTTDQWEETLGWFDGFVAKNQIKGLVKYINDTLGVK